MSESSFDFLATRHRDLLEPILRAEEYAYTDPVTALIRARQFTELMVFKRLDRVAGVARVLSEDHKLRNSIRRLRDSGQVSDLDFARLDEVRQLGNDAVHQNRGSVTHALRALSNCYQVAVQHLGEHLTGTGRGRRTYQPPPRGVGRRTALPVVRRAWIIRPYPHYKDAREVFRSRGLIAIGWHLLGVSVGDLTAEQLHDRLVEVYPANESRWDRDLETILLFRDSMQVNDLVVMAPYRRDEARVAVGQVTTGYRYRPSSKWHPAYCAHQRGIIWHGVREARSALPDSAQRGIRRLTLVETDVHDLLAFCEARGYKLRGEPNTNG